ncbi:VOC family protein [Peredibacter starrii]|uniref:VOC family protein n=1 Tax=Peredibacter starrii TaxID=28202 RepID=A0AAX4HUI9_9BACT|nr:VOC family protein [Peredibacter starrii]WPU66863.1 VOC family protein [Peredibacter starrii]
MNKEQFYQSGYEFLEKLFTEFSEEEIQFEKHWSIDHLCFRTGSDESYEHFKSLFVDFGRLLIESPVNGRLISTFKLFEPFRYKHWFIDLVELPAPKKGKVTKEGFEHIEVVIDVPFADIINRYQGKTFAGGGLSKLFNRELEMELKSGAVKFHHLSLESVVNLEANTKVFHALMNSQVLEKLKFYEPLVTGTFPLNLHRTDSDLDILIPAKVEEVKALFPGATVSENVLSFTFEGVPFEIYCDSIPAVKQKASIHFQVEEKLLKLGGELFYQDLKELRSQGLKTEPAFAQRLHLKDDPYEALLNLRHYTEEELEKLIYGD